MRAFLRSWFLLPAIVSGCTSKGTPITAIYTVPASLEALSEEHFLDHPFPSDFRRDPDNTVRFTGMYNPRNTPIVRQYLEFAKGRLDGFSPIAAGYVRFDGGVDPASLPATPPDALVPDASVQLIDVDPASPERGSRKLIATSFRAGEGSYVLPNTLRWMPALGFPLRPKTRYALVVTSGLKSADGGDALPSAELRQVLGLDPASGATATLAKSLGPALGELAAAGIDKGAIAQLAVFTTSDPTAELRAVADAMKASFPAPKFNFREPWKLASDKGYVEYIGSYGPSPNYQKGKLPFKEYGDGGSFGYVNGKPQPVDTFTPRFSLTVPSNCTMPEKGYPIVLVAHGTGGNFRSHLGHGYASKLGEKCIASMGVDQIFHGTRPGAPNNENDIQLLFFNIENPEAARTNAQQSALDEVQRARLFTETRATIPPSVSLTGKEIRFDPDRVMFFGHSQGGLNGPLYLAIDNSSKGGILSGSGGTIAVALLEKKQPKPAVADIVRTVFLGLSPGDDELDYFHPAIGMAQSVIDAEDPSNYARLIISEPRPGFAPKSIYMSEGIGPDGVGDSYTPPPGIEAHALALGLPLMTPIQYPIPGLAYAGNGTITIGESGLRANLAGGAATGVLAQWPPKSDGHFVVYEVPKARDQIIAFLRSLADGSPGTVPPP
jgi:predicted esterase